MYLKTLILLLCVCIIQFVTGKNDPNCGTKGPKPLSTDGRLGIINGQEAKPHEFPWQCALYRGASFLCGCSIVNSRWVITKYQYSLNSVDYWVIGGLHNTSNFEGTEDVAPVEQIIIHPSYNMTNMDADLALIKLKRDLALDDPTKHMASICIPEEQEEDQIAGHSCIVSGWGAENGIDKLYSDVLNKASMEVWKQDACRKRYQTVDEYMKDITEGMICFGDHAKSTCYGDEGGPLSCELDGRWYLYGVASWEHYLCDGNVAPSVGTRVSHYSKWIWQTIKLNS